MYQRVEKLAFAEVQAEVDNYWGYFDLLTSQLVLGHRQEAEDTLPSVLETVPSDAVYALDTLVGTLTGVAQTLEGYDQAGMLQEFGDRIAEYAKERRANPGMNMVALRPEDTMAEPSGESDEAESGNGEPQDDTRPEDVME